MVRKIVQKWGIIQISKLAKNGGIVQIGRKCSKNKINSKWGILQKFGGICTWGILDFRMWDFGCSPRKIINYLCRKHYRDITLNLCKAFKSYAKL